jgi:protein-S-isoprenylcysteine O-methyltransferase Ste14
VLTHIVRFAVCATVLVFVTGMQFGFSHGSGHRGLRLLLVVSILAAVVTAIRGAWSVQASSILSVASGVTLSALGAGLFLYSLSRHPTRPGKAFAGEAPAGFISNGPYRLARHPIYLSYLLGLSGTTLLCKSWLMVCLTVWMAILYWAAARMEERLMLRSASGTQYELYRQQVGMFCPWR